jgi:hypothetical protein
MSNKSTVGRLGGIAADQWGLVTRRQAEEAGISRATLARQGEILEKVARGVYRLRGAPTADHLDLRAAWLQLAPEVPAWERTPAEGVISHRSAAALYGLGHLPADRHEFTLPTRKQSRRSDVRIHHRQLKNSEWINLRGLFVTRPARIAADLLRDREDPEAVAQIVADAIRGAFDYPGTFAAALGPRAASFELRRGDGVALLRWLLDMTKDPSAERWVQEAKSSRGRSGLQAPAPTDDSASP